MSRQGTSLSEAIPLNASLKESIEHDDNPPREPVLSSINEVIEEPMAQLPLSVYDKLTKRYRRFQVCGITCVIVCLLLIFAIPPFLNHQIVDLAIEQVILKEDNEKLWAHFPGDSQVEIVRNYTFFTLDNQQGMILHGEKPRFREISGYKITELEDFLDIKYLDDGNKVEFLDWLHFQARNDTRDTKEKIRILNMGTLGYWYTLKNARPTLVVQQGIASLFTTIEASILQTVLGQGIFSQFLKTQANTQHTLFTPAGISTEDGTFLWQDPNYGMSNQNHLLFWVNATLASSQYKLSKDALYLKNYFVLGDFQIGFIIKAFRSYIDSLNELILLNHFCEQVTLEQCTGRYLAVRQFAQSKITNDLPPVPNVTATYTICRDNVTCNGENPEFSAYYNMVYKKEFPTDPPVDPFDIATVSKWLDYNKPTQGLNYNTDQLSLLHVGNLDAIWGNGSLYDFTNDTMYLQLIRARFELKDILQAKVFWNWLKYMVEHFTKKGQSNVRLGISSLFSAGLYNGFIFLQDNLQNFLFTRLIRKKIMTTNCQYFFMNSMGITDISIANKICDAYEYNITSLPFIEQMIEVCNNKFGNSWDRLNKAGAKLTNLQQFCETTGGQDSFGYLLDFYQKQLNTIYGCDITPSPYCSAFQLAAIQWMNSGVTRNVPPELYDELNQTWTFSDWNPAAKSVEYFNFITKFNQSQRQQFPNFTLQDVVKVMNFDSWFSSPVVLNNLKNGTFKQPFKKYVRYVCIYVALNGFTTTRTAEEYMFGYEDEYIKGVKEAYPPFGGDPSAPSLIAFNDLNVSKQDAGPRIVLDTGKADYRNLGNHIEINGYKYLTNNYTKFNGNMTYSYLASPWREDDYFYGTSGKFMAPNQFVTDNITLYIPNLQRYGSGTLQETVPVQRFGVDLNMAFIGEELLESTQTSDRNKKYWQTFEAVYNLTSVVGIPLFSTKNHFMNCTGNWSTFIDIYNEDASILYTETSHWDDTFLIIEPYTGVSFQSTIYLQNNYYHVPDELFDYPQESFLPVFSIYRSGNLSETKVNEMYGPLNTGLLAKIAIRYVGVAFLAVSVLVLVYCTYRIKKMKDHANSTDQEEQKPSKNISQLGISLQPTPLRTPLLGAAASMVAQRDQQHFEQHEYIQPQQVEIRRNSIDDTDDQ